MTSKPIKVENLQLAVETDEISPQELKMQENNLIIAPQKNTNTYRGRSKPKINEESEQTNISQHSKSQAGI